MGIDTEIGDFGTAYIQSYDYNTIVDKYKGYPTSLALNPKGGNVGIGKTNPNELLSVGDYFTVDEDGNVEAFSFSGDGSQLENIKGSWSENDDGNLYTESYVGIGTDAPQTDIHIIKVLEGAPIPNIEAGIRLEHVIDNEYETYNSLWDILVEPDGQTLVFKNTIGGNEDIPLKITNNSIATKNIRTDGSISANSISANSIYTSNNIDANENINFGGELKKNNKFIVTEDGNVAIGKSNFDLAPNANLFIYATNTSSPNRSIVIKDSNREKFKVLSNGNTFATKITVEVGGFYDHVFYPTYELMPLPELETYITTNHHLPDVPSEAEVLEKGLDLGEFNATLLKKVEELTLYIIEQDKRIQQLEQNQK